jgi:hypothetical protein
VIVAVRWVPAIAGAKRTSIWQVPCCASVAPWQSLPATATIVNSAWLGPALVTPSKPVDCSPSFWIVMRCKVELAPSTTPPKLSVDTSEVSRAAVSASPVTGTATEPPGSAAITNEAAAPDRAWA